MAFFSSDQAETLAASVVRLAWAAEMQFASETIRIWSGNTTLDLGGVAWTATKGYVTIDGLVYSGDAASEQITLQASGISDGFVDFLGKALAESGEADQRPIVIYLLFLGEDWQPVGGLAPIFMGLMQPPRVSQSEVPEVEGPVRTVTLAAENMFASRSKPSNGRYTDRDQQVRYPGDKFTQFMPRLVFKVFKWPG